MSLSCRFIYILGVLLCQICLIYGCYVTANINGKISDSYTVQGSETYHKCWEIANPEKKLIRINILELNVAKTATEARLELRFNDASETLTYWAQSVLNNITTSASSIQIDFTVVAGQLPDGLRTNFLMQLTDICSTEDIFHCSSKYCIWKSQVCDGYEDCENGVDEDHCGIIKISGVSRVLDEEIAWIMSKRTTSWGWEENTSRVVSALYLTEKFKFDGSDLEEELMAKQTKLVTSVALSRNSLSSEHLSMLINGLLVTCHNPHHFFGQNLIERLIEEIETSNFTHPLTYLSLCNANEIWPNKAKDDLIKVLSANNSFYEFLKDFQAIAVMAVSCYESQTNFLSENMNSNLKKIYEDAIQRFKQMQLPDGSFGNLHTTAFLTQALISSGQENATDWKVDETIHYLVEQIKMPHDLLSSYLVLPIFNAKSLSDISKVNCTLNPKKKGYDDLLSEMNYYDGPKMRVQYSIYMGDDKDVILTLSLKIPLNYTAYEIMEIAAHQDDKFKFKHKSMYVYQVGDITNDSEAGYFWFFYKGLTNTTHIIERFTTSPDKVVMQDEEHLILWYKKTSF